MMTKQHVPDNNTSQQNLRYISQTGDFIFYFNPFQQPGAHVKSRHAALTTTHRKTKNDVNRRTIIIVDRC